MLSDIIGKPGEIGSREEFRQNMVITKIVKEAVNCEFHEDPIKALKFIRNVLLSAYNEGFRYYCTFLKNDIISCAVENNALCLLYGVHYENLKEKSND